MQFHQLLLSLELVYNLKLVSLNGYCYSGEIPIILAPSSIYVVNQVFLLSQWQLCLFDGLLLLIIWYDINHIITYKLSVFYGHLLKIKSSYIH